MEKFSPYVFKTSLLGEKMAFFCGPQGNKFVFTNENKLLTSWWPKSVTKVLLFTEVIDENQKVVAPLLANSVHDILKPEALKQYVSTMDSMARHHMETDWAPYDEVKVHPLSQKYTFTLSCKLFMDEDDNDKVAKVLKNFNIVTNGMISLPLDFPGFTIPKGWKIFWNVNTTHNDPKYFPNPEKFNPSRFEGSGPAPYSYVPFGGGPRMCPGKEYARLEILIFMHNFVKNFKLEKLDPKEKIVYRSTPIPAKGLPVRLTPHAKN
ncbi:beta-amyrin 28-oxidase-like protein [Tanacetum coccineum]